MITRHAHSNALPGVSPHELLHHPQLLSPCRAVRVTDTLIRTTAALAIAGSIAMGAQTVEAAEIGPFVPQMNFDNPLGHTNIMGLWGAPRFADLDGDGDMDAIQIRWVQGEGGSETYLLDFYENTATDGASVFTKASDGDNPFGGISLKQPDVSFGDIDSDGDVDLLYADSPAGTAQLNCYLNEGTPSDPSFPSEEDADNPFKGITISGNAQSCLADLTGDGRSDLFLIDGDDTGTNIRFFPQGGAGTFTEQASETGPFSGISLTEKDNASIPVFADIDNDGDQDLVLTPGGTGPVRFFQNTGTESHASFAEQTGEANPFEAFGLLETPSFSMMDMDGDGDLDLFLSAYLLPVACYRNIGNAECPKFQAQTNSLDINAIDLKDALLSTVSFADIDGDGDLDAFVSHMPREDHTNSVQIYTNVGSPQQPQYEKAEAILENELHHFIMATRFADMDGDGDLDLLASSKGLAYFENIGNATTPSFEMPTSAEDYPFDDIDIYASFVSLADLDNDGDLDLISSSSYKGVNFYRRIDTPEGPAFENEADKLPFSPMDYQNSMAELADVDGDGDYDLIVGGGYNGLTNGFEFYENTGSRTEMNFTKRTGADNPFADISSGLLGMLSVADVDGDGKTDVFVSSVGSPIYYYHNGIPESLEPADPSLPEESAEPDDSYGPCFIGTSHSPDQTSAKPFVAVALAGLASIYATLRRRNKMKIVQ